MIPYSRQWINKDDIQEVIKVLKSSFVTQGPKIKEFEELLARYCGVKYAVAFSSGTAALHAAYYAAGIHKGDEVIVSPLTFAATANMIMAMEATPIFADVDLVTGNLDPRETEKKITKKTKAIVGVDYAGLPMDAATFKKIAKKHHLVFIEDSAHALGASYGKKKVGALADMTMFSFHPVKSITTGEGGAIITHSKKYYEKLLLFRSHGITKDKKKLFKKNNPAWYYEMQDTGFNYRITDIQSALGVSQLKKLDFFIKKRRAIARRYQDELRNLKNFIIPKTFPGRASSWHLFALRLTPGKKHLRNFCFGELRKAGIGVQVHYIPVYQHPYYEALGYKKGLCPNAELFSESEISIPIFPALSSREQGLVIKIIKDIDGRL